MSEEIEKRLLLSRQDKSSYTEILQIGGDTIDELQITFKSGKIMVLR
jgi:hypothetical protein